MNSEEPEREPAKAGRLYSLCVLGRDWIVPQVQFLEADDDQEALLLANSIKPWMEREVWHRHRLVGVLPPAISH